MTLLEIVLVLACIETQKVQYFFYRWRGDFEKEAHCQIYQQCFYLEELSQIQLSISKKKTIETPMKQKLEIKYII